MIKEQFDLQSITFEQLIIKVFLGQEYERLPNNH